MRFRVDAATACRGSPVGVPRREEAIETALANKLADRAAKRELEAARAAKEIEEFSNEFLNAAREVFLMIDKDDSGSLDREEIVASSVLSRRRRGRAATASSGKNAIGLASRRWRGGRDSEACRDV